MSIEDAVSGEQEVEVVELALEIVEKWVKLPDCSPGLLNS